MFKPTTGQPALGEIATGSRAEADGGAPPSRDLLEELGFDLPDRLLDLLPVAVYLCDRDGAIWRYNRRAAELWGRAPKLGDPFERFCGSHRMQRLDGGPLPHAECPMAVALRTGVAVHDQQVVIERPDGSRAVAVVDIDLLSDREGRLVGAINCFRDVTEQWRAEAALREQERHFSEVLQALSVAIYTTDAAGRITFYNEAAARLWGLRPELGKSAWCGSWRLYWPDGRPMPHGECPMALALKQGRAIVGAEAVAERPDGTRVPFLAYPTPLRSESGALVGAVNLLVDLTDRKHAEDSGQRLAAIVESSDDAIVSKDLDGIIMSWNQGAERLFGYTAAEVIGRPITILIPPERHDEEPAVLERVRRGERVDHYETVRRRKDGSHVDISLTVSPVRDGQGRVRGASKIARDITERKRAQEQQKLLLDEMAHRIRNLFALASSMVALSARSAETPEAMAEAVRARLGALARAHGLTLPRLAGAGESAEGGATLQSLVRTIVSPYLDAGRATEQRVAIDGPEIAIGSGAVTGLALLLHEFATNAAKYGALSTAAGRVDVSWAVADEQLVLTWQEHGGPPLSGTAGSEGFGSLLARGTVEGQFGGQLSRDWRPEGLTVRLSLPLQRLG